MASFGSPSTVLPTPRPTSTPTTCVAIYRLASETGGHGYVPFVRANRWFRHVDLKIDNSKKWLVEHTQKKNGRGDGYYGLSGYSAATSKKREYARVSARGSEEDSGLGSRYRVLYLQQPKGWSLHPPRRRPKNRHDQDQE